MKTIILAGGLGTRLRRAVPDRPKPMALVAGRPFLDYVILRLIQAGLCDITLSIGYRGNTIRDHFGSDWNGANISYAEENEPLGTGGAVAYAAGNAGAEPLMIVNGDTFLDLDFAALRLWRQSRGPTSSFAMVLRRVEDVSRYGAVSCDSEIVTGFAEKGLAGPGLINAGVSIIDQGVFSRFGLSGRFSLETDLIQPNLAALRPTAYITDAFFIDIGVEEDFRRAQTEIPRQFDRAPQA